MIIAIKIAGWFSKVCNVVHNLKINGLQSKSQEGMSNGLHYLLIPTVDHGPH